MKLLKLVLSVLIVSLLAAGFAFAGGQKAAEKESVTFFWAFYDGLTEEYRASLQDSFNAAHPEIDVDIVHTKWDLMYDKLTTSIAGGKPPEISVIGTRWLLELMDMGVVDEVTQYLSSSTVDNIAPGAMEAKLGGELMGLPVAAGARILAYNPNLTTVVPKTMEELREAAIKVHNPPKVYGLIMPGKKHTELTDFAYYLFAAGGNFFRMEPDGSYGKCIVNSPEGVKALTFMNQLAEKDKVVQEGYLGLHRMESHPLFYTGTIAYTFIGAWVESAAKQAGAPFQPKYGQIPPFAGQKQRSLIITDSIAMFSGTNLEAAGTFLDFFYQDEWKAKFDELIGFPPVTISAGKLPQFQTPLYQALGEAALNAQGWPLIEEWAECSDIIYDAQIEVHLGRKTPQKALDDAAAAIDKLRGK
ncbi:MAG: extracellular solute-binding protein [Spirochaetaceae bacterium]|nr:MAG: extracellular solute-binding protein [Spirochaetaceae bacterium]